MKKAILNSVSVMAALVVSATFALAQNDPQAAPPRPLPAMAPTQTSITEVIKLTKAGVGDDVVLAYVKNVRIPFRLKADDILQLKDSGVSMPVITAMLNHDTGIADQNRAPDPRGPQYSYNQQAYPPNGNPPPQGQPVAMPDGTNPPPAQGPVEAPLVDNGYGQAPPAQVEAIPASPGVDYYWEPGYWGWDSGWVWIGGWWAPRGYYGWGWGGRGGWGGWHGRPGWGGVHGGGTGGTFWGHGGVSPRGSGGGSSGGGFWGGGGHSFGGGGHSGGGHR